MIGLPSKSKNGLTMGRIGRCEGEVGPPLRKRRKTLRITFDPLHREKGNPADGVVPRGRGGPWTKSAPEFHQPAAPPTPIERRPRSAYRRASVLIFSTGRGGRRRLGRPARARPCSLPQRQDPPWRISAFGRATSSSTRVADEVSVGTTPLGASTKAFLKRLCFALVSGPVRGRAPLQRALLGFELGLGLGKLLAPFQECRSPRAT